jgi:hypothetical protein
LGTVAPYGVYDIAANQGWVNVGIDADTAEFAVESVVADERLAAPVLGDVGKEAVLVIIHDMISE